MDILFLIIGLVAGAIAGAFFIKNKLASTQSDSDKNLINAQTEVRIINERLSGVATERDNLKQELYTERDALQKANDRLARAEEAFRAMQEKLNTQKAEMLEFQQKFNTEFENIANRLLDEKSKKFTEQNRTQLDIILSPFNDKLKDFNERIEKNYKAESSERISLKAEIKQLVELNKQLSDDANNLTSALKGDNKQQGNWGELVLEKVLERSGLQKDREYITQFNTVNDDEQRIKPDVVILLPDDKHIIVDAKVSLDAYNMYNSVNTDEERDRYAKFHIESVRSHVKLLSDKKYQTSEGLHTPDFVLLFLPIESSFSLAIKVDEQLFNYAWDRKIVIVSPTTLLATLKTIASIWKQDRQTRNVLEIAKEGGALYDKFVGFLEDMDKINRGLNAAQVAYGEARKKLSEGRGNLVNQTEKLKKLGAKAEKSIPPQFLGNNEINPLEEDQQIEA